MTGGVRSSTPSTRRDTPRLVRDAARFLCVTIPPRDASGADSRDAIRLPTPASFPHSPTLQVVASTINALASTVEVLASTRQPLTATLEAVARTIEDSTSTPGTPCDAVTDQRDTVDDAEDAAQTGTDAVHIVRRCRACATHSPAETLPVRSRATQSRRWQRHPGKCART